MMPLAANIVLFQAGWFACVLGAARGLPWTAPVAIAAVVGWHLVRARRLGRELALIALACFAGTAFDTLLVALGLVRFHPPAALPPAWMTALWALFATTLNVSLRGLRERPGLAAFLGAASAPLAYAAGARLGALELAPAALPAIAAGWALLLPSLLAVARRRDGYASP